MTTPTTSTSERPSRPLDPIEPPLRERPAKRRGAVVWAPLLALALLLGAWQLVVASGWRPDYLLPGPIAVFAELGHIAQEPEFWQALGRTLSRAVVGFALAALIGTVIGLAAAGSKLLRAAIGSLVTGLQTMPSVVWFPLAILLLGLDEGAIMFVVVLGAAPSIANGVLLGVDQLPPAYFRLGRVLGAKGWTLYRHIVIPGALPAYVSGLNQGWAFAWRSLMAGELLVVIPGTAALGNRLAFAQEFGDATGLMAYMIVILAVGMIADQVFSAWSRHLRRTRGLTQT